MSHRNHAFLLVAGCDESDALHPIELLLLPGRSFFDYFLEKNILGQILELLSMPHTPKVVQCHNGVHHLV